MASTTPPSTKRRGRKDRDAEEELKLCEMELAAVKAAYQQAKERHDSVIKMVKAQMERVEDANKLTLRQAKKNGKLSVFRKLIDGEPMDFQAELIRLQKITEFLTLRLYNKNLNIHDIDWENIGSPKMDDGDAH